MHHILFNYIIDTFLRTELMLVKVFSSLSQETVLCCFLTDATWWGGYTFCEWKGNNVNIQTSKSFTLSDDPVYTARNIHIVPSLALFLPLSIQLKFNASYIPATDFYHMFLLFMHALWQQWLIFPSLIPSALQPSTWLCFLSTLCTKFLWENRDYGRRDPSRWPRGTLYPQKLEVASPTGGGRSVIIAFSWT
jgi:hypothetical protein